MHGSKEWRLKNRKWKEKEATERQIQTNQKQNNDIIDELIGSAGKAADFHSSGSWKNSQSRSRLSEPMDFTSVP